MTSDEKASNRTLMGKCFCGSVHYAVPDEFLYAMNCHCSNCRRATGSAFKPLAGIERDKLSITQGRDGLLVYGDENRNDTHCKACGLSPLFGGPRRQVRPRHHGNSRR
jgi:hypothetical protein